MIQMRLATPGDAAALAVLAERTFRDAFAQGNSAADMDLHCAKSFGEAIQRREICDPQCFTIVADDAGELIAFAHLRRHSPKACVTAQRPAELSKLYVSERWHGRGVAQMLMNEVFTLASNDNADGIWLGVWERNPRAIAFYRKYGFAPVGEHVFVVGEDPQKDLVMAASTELQRGDR